MTSVSKGYQRRRALAVFSRSATAAGTSTASIGPPGMGPDVRPVPPTVVIQGPTAHRYPPPTHAPPLPAAPPGGSGPTAASRCSLGERAPPDRAHHVAGPAAIAPHCRRRRSRRRSGGASDRAGSGRTGHGGGAGFGGGRPRRGPSAGLTPSRGHQSGEGGGG